MKYFELCEQYSISTDNLVTELDCICALIEYYYYKETPSFSDYEHIIELFLGMLSSFSLDQLSEIKHTGSGNSYKDIYLDTISMALKYAGTQGEIGYAYNGIRMIRENAKYLSENSLTEIIRYNSRLNERFFGNYLRYQNIYELIMNAGIDEQSVRRMKFEYIDCQILGREVLKKVGGIVSERYSEYRYVDDDEADNHFYRIWENDHKQKLYLKVEYAGMSQYISLTPDGKMNHMNYIFEAEIHLADDDFIIVYNTLKKNQVLKIDFKLNDYSDTQFDIYDKKIDELFKISNSREEFEIVYLYGEGIHDLPPQHLVFANIFTVQVKNSQILVEDNRETEVIPADFFGSKITTIQALIGKNGSGKSSVFELLCNCNVFTEKGKKEIGKYFIIYRVGENYYYANNTEYQMVINTKHVISEYRIPIDLKVCKISNVFDMYNFKEEKEFKSKNIIDLTTQTLVRGGTIALEQDILRIKNYQLTFQANIHNAKVDRYQNKVVGDDYNNFSSGERARITLFARLLSIFHIDESLKGVLKPIDRSSNYIILFDEAELYFHPAWQRRLILDIRNFVLDINRKYNAYDNISILFSSNSPFLMSDLPTSAIKTLGSVNNKKTFGQNIYSLLKTKFFMDEGVMGAFAQEKIDWALELLTDSIGEEKSMQVCDSPCLSIHDKEQIDYLIKVVGDPMLKEVMKEQMRKKEGV